MQIRRLKLKIQRARMVYKKASRSPLSKKKIGHLETLLKEHLNDTQLHFTMSQIRASNRTAKGRRWTTRDKAFALSLLHSSPKTYRLLRKVFAVPSVPTLRKVMTNLQIYPGFNAHILEALRLKVQSLPPAGKLVCIAMDEMSIKAALSYDAKRDIVEGLEGHQLVDHAIAFVARGIIHRWKQPFGYFFTAGTMSGEQMRSRLFEAITLLHNIGLTVTAVISDQGSNNINLFQTRLGVTVNRPFFVHNGQKIFVIYDPPHLIKNVRNNLRNHGFRIGEKSIEWGHITEFYYKDASKSTRLAPKLTEKHLKLPPFSALRVKLATQVISHSVTTGMTVMAQWGIIDKDAIHTADFLEQFDRLFNAFNSSSPRSSSVMKHSFSASSGHKEFLVEKLKWLKTIRSKGSRMPLCITGWQVAINSLLQLWDFLHTEHDIKYLFTRQLNQDIVENLFAIVRSKGAARDNPDSSQFRAALRQIMVDSVMQPGKHSNCEEDVDEFLISLKNTSVKMPLVPTVPAATAPVLVLCPSIDQSLTVLPSQLSIQETNVIAYIAGYIVRRIKGKICESCSNNISSDISVTDPDHKFLAAKNFVEAKAGLQAPSAVLSSSLQKMEVLYCSQVDDVIHQPKVKATLISLLVECVHQQLVCHACNLHFLIVALMVNIRLHHTIRQSNTTLRDKKSRKDRKTLKFSNL